MEREGVLATRESFLIAKFVREAAEQGRLTEPERQLVRAEQDKISQQVGYTNQDGTDGSDFGEESTSVRRHMNVVQRRKLAELRPELAEELTHIIEHREFRPLPKVSEHLAKPGVALDGYRKLVKFIEQARRDDRIARDDAYAIYHKALQLFGEEGIDLDNLSEKTDKAALVKATQLIRTKLLEIHPEMADEVRNLGPGRSK